MNQKGIAQIVVLVIVLAVAAVGYFGFKKYAPNLFKPKQVSQQIISDTFTFGWKTYRNKEYGFEVKHPESYPIFLSGVYGSQTIISIKNADIFGIFIDRGMTVARRLEIENKIFSKNKIEKESIEFADVPTIKLQIDNPKGFSKILIFESPNFSGTVFTISIAESVVNRLLADEILSTFKFIR